jgi:hypothetical protein
MLPQDDPSCVSTERDSSVKIYNTSNELILEVPGDSLRGADLRCADLPMADLLRADLPLADLRRSDLRGSDLQHAKLQNANLMYADLKYADLKYADLMYAHLQGANLQNANLRNANLQDADLQGANLQEADLRDADLRGARYDYSTIGIHQAPSGCLLGWKKLYERYLISLRIPSKARRSCATTRKHRAEFARVLRIVDIDSGEEMEEVLGGRWPTRYRAGELVYPDKWDTDRWNECSHGIHFFLTEAEAMAW